MIYYENDIVACEEGTNYKNYYSSDGSLAFRVFEKEKSSNDLSESLLTNINGFKKADEYYITDVNYKLYFHYFHLGTKTKENNEHWTENFELSPNKKTLVVLGGSLTEDERAANGNLNVALRSYGFSDEQKEQMQSISCYRNFVNEPISRMYAPFNIKNLRKLMTNSCKTEVSERFMPFMVREKNGKKEKYTDQELKDNFKNILIDAHCIGCKDLEKFSQSFREIMKEIGYSSNARNKLLNK